MFSIFWGYFFPSGSGSGSEICMRIRIQQLKLMRIRIRNPDRGPVKMFFSRSCLAWLGTILQRDSVQDLCNVQPVWLQ
jgi:hypothetical protein